MFGSHSLKASPEFGSFAQLWVTYSHFLCIKAETGVGPSIAIGNQTWSKTCELLAIAPINKHIPIIVTMFSLTKGASENTVL